jgi:hypothetical protein
MKIIITIIFCIILAVIIYNNYDNIPSRIDHINRNKYNILPVGTLRHIAGNKYIDYNNVIWIKRGFLNSLLHNPFTNYVFETYNRHQISSSEVQILKTEFDNGIQNFRASSFNYYSSFNSPISHLFADVLPIIIYLRPKYKLYN